MHALLPRLLQRRLLVAAAVVLASSHATPVRADDLCGCWSGRWYDCTSGHEGIVKAEIAKCGPNKYRAVFSGWAFKIMPYRYVAYLTGHVDPETGKTVFCCKRKLGFGGSYVMNGWAKGCTFYARYHTDDSVGYFKMRKVECKH